MAEGNPPPNDHLNEQIKGMTISSKKKSRGRGKRGKLPTADSLRAHHRTEITEHRASLETECKHVSNNPNNKIYSSKTPFAKLTRTVLPELRLEVLAKDKYIIVRIIEEGYECNGYNTVVEDHVGNVRSLVIFNFPLDELIGSVGSALIIKEPYLQMNKSGNAFIRCDCPSDIFFLRPTFHLYHLASEIKWKNQLEEGFAPYVLMGDVVCEKPGEWNELGDQLANEVHLPAAREAFRLAIRCCTRDDPNELEIRFKLLDLHLLTQWYEWATEECDDILKKFSDHPDTLHLVGLALINLRNFQRALIMLQKYFDLYPNQEESEPMLSQVKTRVREEAGDYNFETFRQISQNHPFVGINCAEYISSAVDIKQISGKGQGLMLNQCAAKDRILFVSKALVTFYPRGHYEKVPEGGNVEDLMCSTNVKKLIHLVYKNPNLIGSQVYQLFTGSSTDEPIKQFCYPEEKDEAICDVEKIRAIYQCNKFKITETIDGKIVEKGEGLFLFPSYLNHSCSPNVDIEFINDIMVGRASRKLRYDTELTISYVPLDMDLAQRKKMLRRRGIEECLCDTCKQKR